MANTTNTTTEAYIAAVRDIVIERAIARGTITDEQAERLAHTKMLYGVGDGTYRGVTIYKAWKNGVGNVDIVEIAATGQESWIQLAGTVIHELAHVLAGHGAGHAVAWKDMAKSLGFTIRPLAAGQVYRLAMIDPVVRVKVHAAAQSIADGAPGFASFLGGFGGLVGLAPVTSPRPCSAGVGTRGGKSRGKGSGSRLRLWECGCPKPVKVRVASDDFRATCDVCGTAFARKDAAAAKAA